MGQETIDKLYARGNEAFLHSNDDSAIRIVLEPLELDPDHTGARRAPRICETRQYDGIGSPSRLTTRLRTFWTSLRLFLRRRPGAAIRICEGHLAHDPRNATVSLALAKARPATRLGRSG